MVVGLVPGPALLGIEQMRQCVNYINQIEITQVALCRLFDNPTQLPYHRRQMTSDETQVAFSTEFRMKVSAQYSILQDLTSSPVPSKRLHLRRELLMRSMPVWSYMTDVRGYRTSQQEYVQWYQKTGAEMKV